MPVPVNDLGYRKWDGEISSAYFRWLTIALSGIKIVFKSQWIKRIMFLSWIPALAVGGLFFFYEQYVEIREDQPALSFSRNQDIREFEAVRGVLLLFSSNRQAERVIESFTKEPNEARGYVWSFILLQMLRRTQGWMLLLLIGLIAPPLIAKDMRSRAFLFYFSKPISRTDYLIGKFSVIGFYVGFVTILPAIALYLFGILLSPNLSVIATTWVLPLRVIAACLVMIVPSCLIALTLSSLTTESRFAGFAWFMVWILGFVGYQIVSTVQQLDFGANFEPRNVDSLWRLVSLYDCLGFLQGWVMGLEDNHQYAITMSAFVVGICVACVYTILQKISAPLKA
ncbi:MAG: ABC transporter permease subunit [Planctomycetota bacterium]|nr:ABC transporter permease subunit [Planctomycetota bacterium]